LKKKLKQEKPSPSWNWPITRDEALLNGQLQQGDKCCVIDCNTEELVGLAVEENTLVKVLGKVDHQYAIEVPIHQDPEGNEIPAQALMVGREHLDSMLPLHIDYHKPFIKKSNHIRCRGAGGAGIHVNGDFGHKPVRM
jgi:hypothetical protein